MFSILLKLTGFISRLPFLVVLWLVPPGFIEHEYFDLRPDSETACYCIISGIGIIDVLKDFMNLLYYSINRPSLINLRCYC